MIWCFRETHVLFWITSPLVYVCYTLCHVCTAAVPKLANEAKDLMKKLHKIFFETFSLDQGPTTEQKK